MVPNVYTRHDILSNRWFIIHGSSDEEKWKLYGVYIGTNSDGSDDSDDNSYSIGKQSKFDCTEVSESIG